MYRELGLLLVLLLPVVLVYLSRSEHLQPSSKSKTKKAKKKNKKKATKSVTTENDDSNYNNNNNNNNNTSKTSLKAVTISPSYSVNNDVQQPSSSSLDDSTAAAADRTELPTTTTNAATNDLNSTSHLKSKQHKLNKTKQRQQEKPRSSPAKPPKKADFPPLAATPSPPQHQLKTAMAKEPTTNNSSNREIDEHMDMTPRFSRVMRIRPETPDEPLSPVPYEDGWNRTKTKSHQGGGGFGSIEESEPLTKKQRENRARTAKKKELKAQADALQEQRLKQHQRQLENERIKAFYATGAGKHTQWGSKPKNNNPPGSSKVPNGKAGLDESGQLIWD